MFGSGPLGITMFGGSGQTTWDVSLTSDLLTRGDVSAWAQPQTRLAVANSVDNGRSARVSEEAFILGAAGFGFAIGIAFSGHTGAIFGGVAGAIWASGRVRRL
jgi:hypothetical protein